VGNIFIKNLDKSITNSALADTFSVFGHIISCKVEVDQNGVSKGYGYVHFETQEEADQAIAKVNGMQMADKIVFVGPFQPKKARGGESTSTTFTNIYVKNLDTAVTKEQLDEMFGAHGKITSCAIMSNEKGESRGFGFINYETPEAAQAAVEKLNGTTVNGKQIYVGRAQKRSERDEVLRSQRAEQLQKYQGANVYVKNLDDNVDDEKLQQEFGRFGPIVSAKVMSDERGNSKGFGFVSFANAEDASRAIGEMNGVIFGTKPLYASLAQRKDVRRSQLAVLHQQKMNMMQMNMGMPMNMRGPNMMYPGAPPVFYPPMPGRMNQPGYPPQMIPRGAPRFPPPPGGQPPQQPANPNGPPQQGQPPFARGPAQGFPPQGAQGGQGFPPQQGVQGQQGGRGAGRPRNPRPPPAQQPQGQPNGAPAGAGRGGKGPQNAQGQVNRSYKYTSTARNQPGYVNQQGFPPQQFQVPPEVESDPEAGKQMAGEQLYAQIVKVQPALAGKITGMLIESLELRELFGLVQNPALLEGKVNEALAVLQSAPGEQGAEAQVIA
jgi:polyadenylate-binding protein